jgi:ankyrin repeat protein
METISCTFDAVSSDAIDSSPSSEERVGELGAVALKQTATHAASPLNKTTFTPLVTDFLLIAAADGDQERVKELLARPEVDINDANEDGVTALMAAAKNGSAPMVRLLLQMGAEIGKEDCWGRVAISHAKGAAVTAIFLDRGAECDHTDEIGWTPLFRSAMHNDVVQARLLLKAGADPNSTDGWEKTPLETAWVFRKDDVGKLLLKAGADPGEIELCHRFWDGRSG